MKLWRRKQTKYSVLKTGDQIKKNEVGGAFSMHGKQKMCMQDSGGEIGGKETTWKTYAQMGMQ